ncbi:hypothetical protein J2128_002181 [Methanomicrobium sp. W14]|nr:hypothetical protein [Methanomicrobium sp. W14]
MFVPRASFSSGGSVPVILAESMNYGVTASVAALTLSFLL